MINVSVLGALLQGLLPLSRGTESCVCVCVSVTPVRIACIFSCCEASRNVQGPANKGQVVQLSEVVEAWDRFSNTSASPSSGRSGGKKKIATSEMGNFIVITVYKYKAS